MELQESSKTSVAVPRRARRCYAFAAMLLYALVIFAGAFLLFEVQPIIAKLILPWFGGSAAVWITCLLFFQVALCLGYVYAYGMIRWLRPRTQAQVHCLLLGASVLALQSFYRGMWHEGACKSWGARDPALGILGVLVATVGLPYFLLAATGPLAQAWYIQGRRGAAPYRLFALSNTASLLALVSYPVLVEPIFSNRHQVAGWSLAYAGFAILCAGIALRRRGEAVTTESPAPEPPGPEAASALPAPPTWGVQLLWVGLAACASTLLLAISHHLTQNIAPIPFLWVFPLSLYLLSFIVCFQGRSWYRRDLYLRFLAVALGGMAYALAPESLNASLVVLIPLYCVGLFLCCTVCHGELERLKPDPAYLTSFYLMISLGGAAGGVFVGWLAPRLFRSFVELPIGIASLAVLLLIVLYRDLVRVYGRRWQPGWLALVALAVILIAGLSVRVRKEAEEARLMARNFYGTLRVVDLPQIPRDGLAETSVIEPARRKLVNGSIDHGLQFLTADRRRLATTYYGPRSGAGLALAEAGKWGALRVGVIGLGAGTLATYGRRGDHYTFYELNPLVIQLANDEFTFLKDSEAKVDVVRGDARLSLEQEPPQAFDVLAVDAFQGDSIPVHLLTREAFALYFRHLKGSGVLAVHITNRYLDLRPAIQLAAESLGKLAIVVENDKDEKNEVFRSTWVLVGSRREFFNDPEIKKAGAPLKRRAKLRLWTDDYSNLFQILKR